VFLDGHLRAGRRGNVLVNEEKESEEEIKIRLHQEHLRRVQLHEEWRQKKKTLLSGHKHLHPKISEEEIKILRRVFG